MVELDKSKNQNIQDVDEVIESVKDMMPRVALLVKMNEEKYQIYGKFIWKTRRGRVVVRTILTTKDTLKGSIVWHVPVSGKLIDVDDFVLMETVTNKSLPLSQFGIKDENMRPLGLDGKANQVIALEAQGKVEKTGKL